MPDNSDAAVTQGEVAAPPSDTDGAPPTVETVEQAQSPKPDTRAGVGSTAPKTTAAKAAAKSTTAKSSTARSAAAKSSTAKATGAKSAGAKSSTAKASPKPAAKSTTAKAAASKAGAAARATKAGGAKSTAKESAILEHRLELLAERLRKLNERIIEAGREAGEATLSSYEKALKTIANGIERGPGSSEIDWLAQVATAQAKFIRDLTDTWTKAARGRLK